jgi:hypothetical protein
LVFLILEFILDWSTKLNEKCLHSVTHNDIKIFQYTLRKDHTISSLIIQLSFAKAISLSFSKWSEITLPSSFFF